MQNIQESAIKVLEKILDYNLDKSSLIEASAGCGKTYTLSLLYLRLLLGLGVARPLNVEEILVITFTKSATSELKLRIREVIKNLLEVLSSQAPLDILKDLKSDWRLDFIKQLIQDQSSEEIAKIQKSAKMRLKLAYSSMDDASIHTIDAWCNKVLRTKGDLADFDTQRDINANIAELKLMAAEDFWRNFTQGFSLDCADLFINKSIKNPQKLADFIQGYSAKNLHLIKNLTAQNKLKIPEPKDLSQEDFSAQVFENSNNAKKFVLAQADLFFEVLKKNSAAISGTYIRANRLSKEAFSNLFGRHLDNIAKDPINFAKNPKKETLLSHLVGEQKHEKTGADKLWKKGALKEVSPEDLAKLEELRKLFFIEQEFLVEEFLQIQLKVFVQTEKWLTARLEFLKSAYQVYEFSDLVKILARILQDKTKGAQLRKNLAKKYPFAFVDEFQDTNLEQFQILDAIYKICPENWQKSELSASELYSFSVDTKKHLNATLVVIGDPKQSIYSFRDADLEVYLKARSCINNTNSLITNYRSDAGLINSINAFFGYFDKHTGKKAFYIKQEGITDNKKIDFTPVKSSAKSLKLLVDGQEQAPLKFILATYLDEEDKNRQISYQFANKATYRQEVSKKLAYKIAHLINADAQILDKNTGEQRSVALSDFSILVNDRFEAKSIQQELAKLNIEGIFLSSDEKLIDTFIFRDLSVILQAAKSLKAKEIKQALTTKLVKLTMSELLLLNEDVAFWDQQVARFEKYHQLWTQKSLGHFLDAFIDDYQLLPKIKELEGTRILVDFLHLVEILQEKDFEHQQPSSLLDYLENIGQKNTDFDREQRFLPDKSRVQIVTIHASKGLEYNLVFVPFAIHRAIKNSAQKNMSEEEINAAYLEEVRKFYVAVTRAKICVWLGMNDVKSIQTDEFSNSIFNFWLAQKDKNAIYKDFIELLKSNKFADFLKIAQNFDKCTPIKTSATKAQLKAPLTFVPKNIHLWHMHSYTEIKTHIDADAKEQEPLLVTPAETGLSLEQTENLDVDAFDFLKRGKETGLLIHKIFELAGNWQSGAEIGFGAFVREDSRKRLDFLTKMLRAYPDKSVELEELEQKVLDILKSNIFKSNFSEEQKKVPQLCLETLKFEHYGLEVEFIFDLPELKLKQLDNFLHKHFFQNSARGVLKSDILTGALKGFIDLLVEKDGKFYALDYKSNQLDLSQMSLNVAMQKEILKYRYDLQAAIYLYGLHKILTARLQNYDPETHLGGVGFLFLRKSSSYLKSPSASFLQDLENIFN